jgi:hypothetical protein
MKKKLIVFSFSLFTVVLKINGQDFIEIPTEKKYWVEVCSGVNQSETFTSGDEIKNNDRHTATTIFKIGMGKKISAKTSLYLGYYSLYYEYDYKSSFGDFDFVVSSGNTSTRIPLSIRHDIFTLKYKKNKFSIFGEGGVILESVKGRNHEVLLQSNLNAKESFNNGIYGLLSIGGGTIIHLGQSFGFTLSGQKTFGFKSFMQKDFIATNDIWKGSASINGSGNNFTIGVQYYF